MAEELHASLSPNVVNVGETVEVEVDSSAEEWQDAEHAIIRVFEVDDASPFEPKPGKAKVVVTCEGEISDNSFTLKPAAKGKSNPDVSSPAGANAPVVKLSVGGTTVDVPLPNKDQEQGVFELRVQLEIKKPKAKTFTSKAKVMVRSFDHFTANGQPRPVVAFITGGRDDSYFQAASKFWTLNADVVVKQKELSIQEALDMLDKEHEKFGDWGQINIVAHGRERGIFIKLFKDSEKGVHRDKIEREIERHANAKPPGSLPQPGGIDGDTQIVMRACNAGRDSELIDALHSDVFDSSGSLFVPKFVQVYQYSQTGGTVTANEWFEESLTFDTPGSSPPKPPALQAGLEQAWDTLDSPGKGGDKDVEIPLFTANHDWVQTFPFTLKQVDEGRQVKADGSQKTDTELVDDLRTDWSSVHELDQKSETWDTTDDRWEIKVKSKSQTKIKSKGKAKKPDPGYSLELEKGTSTIEFQHFIGGWANVGAAEAENVWVIEGEGVADLHFNVEFGPGPKQAKVHDANSGEPTTVGSTKLTDGASKEVTLPATIEFGAAKVRVRQAKPMIDIEFECKRHHVDRRRQLRLFEQGVDYADRQLVVPKVGDPDHYGSS